MPSVEELILLSNAGWYIDSNQYGLLCIFPLTFYKQMSFSCWDYATITTDEEIRNEIELIKKEKIDWERIKKEKASKKDP